MMHYGNMVVEYKLPIITVNPDGSLRGKGGLLEDEAVEFTKMLDAAGIDMIQVSEGPDHQSMFYLLQNPKQPLVQRALYKTVLIY